MNNYQQLTSSELLDSKQFSFTEFGDSLLLPQQHQQQPPPPPPIQSSNVPVNAALTGVYSNTGFDMIQILSRLIHR